MIFDTEQMILPTPGRSFEWLTTASGTGLVCREIEPYALHLFTTSRWAFGSRDAPVDEASAWRQVASALDLEPGLLIRLRQVHGNAVVIASPDRNLTYADIIVNRDPALGAAVQTADCVPALLVDPRTGAVAAAHAGWRGLAAGVPGAAVTALSQAFGSRPADLIVALGPSIGACCYEVGRDVRDAFSTAGFSSADRERWFLGAPASLPTNPSIAGLPRVRRPDHWYFDGWASAHDQLRRAGVRPEQILAAGLCTASHPEVMCSYRRDGAAAGRMVAAVRPRPQRP